MLEESQAQKLERLLGNFPLSEKGREVIQFGAKQTLRFPGEEKFSLEIESKALDSPIRTLEEKL